MAEAAEHSVTLPRGFYAGGIAAGIKPSGKADLAVIASDRPAAAAGLFTRSRTPAEPVRLNRRHLREGSARAVVVNAGVANAATGRQGAKDAAEMAALTAKHLNAHPELGNETHPLRPRDVLVGSTGVIGVPLPMEAIRTGIARLLPTLDRGPAPDAAAAGAILTTDLVTKTAHSTLEIDGRSVHVGGIAKGSGMIAPNLATMLVYITTDADVQPGVLHTALGEACRASFNRISVDQHTSPSDMVIALANGASGVRVKQGEALERFNTALADLCRDLAYQIVADGEGATRIFRVRITGARSEREADRVGKAVIDSPLVKTAVHGADPNWGRIVTAAGYSGASIQPGRMSLAIGSVRVFEAGTPNALDAAQQAAVDKAMQQKEVTFTLELGRGSAEAEWLGCDLSYDYVRINAEYTT